MDSRLRHAVAVGRHASFSRAAEAVGVTQSAVTKSVADLERRIGHSIFHRTSKGAIPTEEGREFLDRAARLVADTNDLLVGRRPGDDPYQGVLRVGIFPGSLEWMLTSALTELVRRHPGIRIDIVTGSSERGMQLLGRGDVDLAFGMTAAFENWGDLLCETNGTLSTHCFVRRGHPILDAPMITLDEIAQYVFVSSSMSAPYTDTVREIYESRGIASAGMLHIVDFFPLVRGIVAETTAIGVIADSTTLTASFERDFVVLREPVVFPAVSVGCATRAKSPLKPAAKALRHLLTSRLPLISRSNSPEEWNCPFLNLTHGQCSPPMRPTSLCGEAARTNALLGTRSCLSSRRLTKAD